MYTCWGHSAEWYLIADDDTFVRPTLLEQVLAGYRPGDLHLLGLPVDSNSFTTVQHKMLYGSSLHCGGPHVLLSAALAAEFAPKATGCLKGPPRTHLPWYWDEIELLGRCLYEEVRVNCSMPAALPVPEGEVEFGVFIRGNATQYEELDEYVTEALGGDWQRLPFAATHPVEARDMDRFQLRFGTGDASTTRPVSKEEL